MNSMKKYMMAVALMVLSVMTAVAQDVENPVGKISVIPRIGVVLSNWSNNKIYFATEENADYMKSKYQAGFMGGVDFEYRATEQVGISLGAYYAKQGFRWPSYQTESKDNGKTVLTGYNNQHVDLNYIQVPLMVKAYVTRQLALLLGVQAGFLLGDAKYKGDSSEITIDNSGHSVYEEKESFDEKWPAKKCDVSIPIGVSYEYQNVILDARYQLGLSKVDKMANMPSQSKTNAFTVSVGYRFTL